MKSIVVKIKALAASERKITAEILDCIREIEAQKIHFEMGYPGLLEFLVQECGYSESSAFRRINAARLTGQVPGLREDLQSGNLTLTQVSTAARGFRQKEKLGKKLSLEEKTEVLSALKNKSSFEAQQITAKLLELPVLSQEKIKPQADESVRLEMTLSKEEMELVQRAREILGYISPGMSWKELFVFMARDLIKRRDPAREVRVRAQKPSMGQGQGQDKNQNRNQNQNQVQNQSKDYSQRRSQSQSNNPNEIQEQGRGDTTLLKPLGLNSEIGHFDDTTKIPLASSVFASALLGTSSELHSRSVALDLAPSPKITSSTTPTPATAPALEHRSSATLARWVNLSNLRSGAQIQGVKLQGSELPRSELIEAEPLRAEPPGAEMAETEVPKSHQPMFELSAAEEMRFSSKITSTATPSSAFLSSAVPASLRRHVFRRDQNCQWLDPVTGRKCGSRHLLELDHIQPRWAGGLNEPLNLRLLCRSHNNLKYSLEARIEARLQSQSARVESR